MSRALLARGVRRERPGLLAPPESAEHMGCLVWLARLGRGVLRERLVHPVLQVSTSSGPSG